MNLIDIAQARMYNQQITGNECETTTELVDWMGAMQAQDAAMMRWALGIRLPKTTEKSIIKALDAGEIIRTHLMRPTWHIVSASEIYWMLELTGPSILSSLKGRHKQLELDAKIIYKSNETIVKELEGGKHLIREELNAVLEKVGIDTSNNRASHLLMLAELEGLICSGIMRGNKQTYALLAERVPKKFLLPKEEALAKLAEKYFTSHAPATLQDFIWWSGLKIKDARQALELIKSTLISTEVNEQTYWFNDDQNLGENKNTVLLLPAFDEYLISYTDRTASITSDNHKKAISYNGIFWPIIVINGLVKGVWKRVVKNNKVAFSINLFEPVSDSLNYQIKRKAIAYGEFLNKEITFI